VGPRGTGQAPSRTERWRVACWVVSGSSNGAAHRNPSLSGGATWCGGAVRVRFGPTSRPCFMAGRRDRAGSLPQGAGPRHLPLRGYPWLVNTVGARDTSFRDGRARGTSQIHFKISVCSHGFIDSVFGGEGHTLTRRNQYGRVGPVEKRQAHETAPNSNCVRDVVFTNNSSLTSGAACTRVELAAVKRVAAQQGQRVTVLRHD